MAAHSSTLAWKIPGRRSLVGCSPWGREESGMTERLLSLFTFLHWRRKWQPTPVFLPGESQGLRSLVGCRLWGRTESDTTDATWQQQQQQQQRVYVNTSLLTYPFRPPLSRLVAISLFSQSVSLFVL